MILDPDILLCSKRGDWKNTKEIIKKGKEWIINEIKYPNLEEEVEQAFLLD